MTSNKVQTSSPARPASSPLGFEPDEVIHVGVDVHKATCHVSVLSNRRGLIATLAVEPSQIYVDWLRHSVARSRFDRVHVVHAAVGDRPGTVRFRIAGLWGMVDHGGSLTAEAERAPAVEVTLETGDAILERCGWDRVDLLKVDVEGSEIAAFRGLERLLRRDDAPVIVYECNGLTLPYFGYRTSNLVRLLERYGYRSYRVEPGQLRPLSASDLQPEAWVDLVALKPRHEAIAAAEIGSPLSADERIERVIKEGGKAHLNFRRYIAETVGRADDEVLTDRRIVALIDTLADDPDASIRLALAWRKSRRVHAA
jgi:FkbM family methyltransferase